MSMRRLLCAPVHGAIGCGLGEVEVCLRDGSGKAQTYSQKRYPLKLEQARVCPILFDH